VTDAPLISLNLKGFASLNREVGPRRRRRGGD